MPIWLAASPTPGAAYIVSIMSSASRARAPLNSVTSGQRCFSPRSPKTRMGNVAMGGETTGEGSQAKRIDLGPETAGRATGGEGIGEGIGQALGGRGADEDGGVGPARHADAFASACLAKGCRRGGLGGELAGSGFDHRHANAGQEGRQFFADAGDT